MLEVTENAVVDDYEHLKELLAPLVERGMILAVDDFGAGAANMRHVDALAPRYLKLDRTLVADIAADPRKSAMVRLRSIVTQSDAVTVTQARELFAREAHLTAIALVDRTERVRALLTRHRLLTPRGLRGRPGPATRRHGPAARAARHGAPPEAGGRGLARRLLMYRRGQ